MPIVRYDKEIASGKLQPDDEQRLVMNKLDRIADDLAHRSKWKRPQQSVFAKWFPSTQTDVSGVTGLYLWGGVGRGKTYLCDLFFEAVPIDDKMRLHFHRFMQRIHADLRALGEVEDPLPLVADQWSAEARLLLLDEIHVNDITDAMLLGRLLTELFKRGVTLVTTSNVPPNGLYRDGLQRARFLPAIAQIQNHCTVYEMGSGEDYRLRLLQSGETYLVGKFVDGVGTDENTGKMQVWFDRLRQNQAMSSEALSINGRSLPVVAYCGDVVWLEFGVLCQSPRSTDDYIELASSYKTVMINNLPVLDDLRNDEARRLVNMVDEMYDCHTNLIISAEAGPHALYTGKRLAFEFERAASRLTEMQTSEYLAQPSRPKSVAA